MMTVEWELPQMDGIEIARKVRAGFSKEELNIAVAAYDWSVIKTAAMEAGADYFLQKPLFPSTIYNFLISMTQDKRVDTVSGGARLFSGEQILLVEDNDINLEIAQTLLETRNLKVETARDGEEALENFRRHPSGYYYAILMDIQMPVMNGLEASRKIRSLPRKDAKTIPIIAMSANAFDEDVEKSLEAGMNAHVSKPVDIPVLFRVLEQFCNTDK